MYYTRSVILPKEATKRGEMSWAVFVSKILDPVLEIPIILGLVFKKSGGFYPSWFFPTIFFLDAGLPLSFLIFAYKKGIISDWETTKREERYLLNFFCLLCWTLGFFLIAIFGNNFLIKINFILLFLMGVYSLITFFWKISGHVTTNTALVLILIRFWGLENFWWSSLAIPLVSWARVACGKHDFWQVLGGAVLGFLVVGGGLWVIL